MKHRVSVCLAAAALLASSAVGQDAGTFTVSFGDSTSANTKFEALLNAVTPKATAPQKLQPFYIPPRLPKPPITTAVFDPICLWSSWGITGTVYQLGTSDDSANVCYAPLLHTNGTPGTTSFAASYDFNVYNYQSGATTTVTYASTMSFVGTCGPSFGDITIQWDTASDFQPSDTSPGGTELGFMMRGTVKNQYGGILLVAIKEIFASGNKTSVIPVTGSFPCPSE